MFIFTEYLSIGILDCSLCLLALVLDLSSVFVVQNLLLIINMLAYTDLFRRRNTKSNTIFYQMIDF